MKTLSLWLALATVAMGSLCLIGCIGGTETTSKESIDQVNKGLPPDDGKGQGLVSPVRPGTTKR